MSIQKIILPLLYLLSIPFLQSCLAQNESIINFTFLTPSGGPADQVSIIHNSDTSLLSLDSLGQSIFSFSAGKQQFKITSKWFQTITVPERDYIANKPIEYTFHLTSKEMDMPEIIYEFDKPVLYFYPKKRIKIKVKLNFEENLGFTYPNYENEWNFTANKEGNLSFENHQYRYLFWEGKFTSIAFSTLQSGFIVTSDSLTPFFEKQLKILGLSSSEQQDFITYWVPIMQQNEFNFIHFLDPVIYSKIAPIDITPLPDSFQRIFICWRKANAQEKRKIIPQQLTPFQRKGFTVIEWGGCQIENKQLESF